MSTSKNVTDSTNISVVVSPMDIASPIYVGFVDDYMKYAKKAAENFIKLGQTLNEAKANLAPKHFTQFCKEIGLVEKGPAARKLSKIGEMAGRFDPYLSKMPAASSTVYKLAILDDEEFARVVESDRFSPIMTAKDVDSVFDDKTKERSPKKGLFIDLSGISPA